MSFNTRKIESAARRLGLGIRQLHWEPVRRGNEMCGAAGGWTVMLFDTAQVVSGYTAAQVVEELERVAHQLDQDPRWP